MNKKVLMKKIKSLFLKITYWGRRIFKKIYRKLLYEKKSRKLQGK